LLGGSARGIFRHQEKCSRYENSCQARSTARSRYFRHAGRVSLPPRFARDPPGKNSCRLFSRKRQEPLSSTNDNNGSRERSRCGLGRLVTRHTGIWRDSLNPVTAQGTGTNFGLTPFCLHTFSLVSILAVRTAKMPMIVRRTVLAD
jgi:hypothetical protein